MKVCVVRPGPHFSVQDVAVGWVNALRHHLGASNVGDFPFDSTLDFYDQAFSHITDPKERWNTTVLMACNALMAQLYKFMPDVVIVVSGFFTPPELLQVCRAHGHKLVFLVTESPYQDDDQIQLAAHFDLAVVNDPTNLERFQQVTTAYYSPHAYDPAKHYRRTKIEDDWRSDFCFVGTGYPSRVEFFEAVDWTGIDVAIGGNWQALGPRSPLGKFLCHDDRYCLENSDAIDLYSATKASANIYRREAQRPELSEGWAMGPREVELAAVGCFYLTEPRGENREVLPMIPTFGTPDDFGEQLRWWLSHDKERREVAAAAQRAIADRTFVNHAAELLRRVG